MNATGSVVIDTSALYALVSANDRFHRAAAEVYGELVRLRSDIWTTSYVLVEFGAITHRRLGFPVLSNFYRGLTGSVKTVWIDRERHEATWTEMERINGRGLSFVDWTVVLAAKELGATIFAFDGDFHESGVPLVPKLP